MLKIPTLLFAVLVSVVVCRPLVMDAADVYVSPTGSDTATGGNEAPVASLKAAFARARAMGDQAVTIWMADGTYSVEATIDLNAFDSGSATAPLTVRAQEGANPVLVGGRVLDMRTFRAVEPYDAAYPRLSKVARKRVLVCQLDGAAAEGASKLLPRGIANRKPAPAEVFAGARPLSLAGWPDAGRNAPNAGIVNGFFLGADRVAGRTMAVQGAPVSRWAKASEAWAHGYWFNDWADYHLKVDAVDARAGTITLATDPDYGFGEDRPFRIYNLPEELSTPGEYWIDATTGLLYVWPPQGFGGEPVYVSEFAGPLVRVDGSRHITFRGITFEATRERLVEVRDGVDIVFDRCTFRNSGTDALLLHGRNNMVSACEFSHTGAAAIDMSGGDRSQLLRGNNRVINSYFHDLGRHCMHGSAAVLIYGVGNEVRNNLMVRLPHVAIQYTGNLHSITGNEIVAVCQFSSDAGAIYTGRDWVGYGNRIEGNIIRDIQSPLGENWVHGVYLDDCASGTTVRGNVFDNIGGAATNLGGGRANVVENNVFANCGFSAHVNDNRGLKWANNKPRDSWNLVAQLRNLGVTKGLWPILFPDVAQIPQEWDAVKGTEYLTPQGSVFARNVGWGNKQFAYEQDWVDKPDWVFGVYKEFGNNAEALEPLFAPDTLRTSSARGVISTGKAEGFAPIDLRKVGPQVVYAVDPAGNVAFDGGLFKRVSQRLVPATEPAVGGGRSISASLVVEYFFDVKGDSLASLPPPDAVPGRTLEIDNLTLPANVADSYATRVRGYIVPPESGEYTFWITGDDSAQFSLSTSDNPADLQPLAELSQHVNPGQWDRYPSQKSDAVLLHAGQRYYFVLVHKDGWGGDYVDVAWSGPGFERTIVSNQSLQPFEQPDDTDGGVSDEDAPLPGAEPPAPEPVPPTAGLTTGSAQASFYHDINGPLVSDLETAPKYPGSPDRVETLSRLSLPRDAAEQYGVAVRGYIVPPTSGTYTFWIASDNGGSLRLSTGSSAADLREIATVSTYTLAEQWDKAPGQMSAPISLTAGQPYCFEAIMKEEWGGDHLDVAWAGPGFSRQVIEGQFLAHGDLPAVQPEPPTTGGLKAYFYDNVKGERVANLQSVAAFPASPSRSVDLDKLEFSAQGDNYGSLAVGYIVPQASGSYTFYVTADDDAVLLLSPSDDAAQAREIARTDGYIRHHSFTAKPVQQSAPVALVAGQCYYIEVLHKEGWNDDYCAVAWEGPGIALQVITGEYLAPYGPTEPELLDR